MTNFPELRPGERSAEAERVAVLRSASPVRLAALAMFVAAIFMAVMLLGAPGRSEGPPAFLSKALGAADAEAPLVRHPEAGVELAIQDSSFRIRSSSATVTLATQGAGPGDWHRFEHGVSRPIAEGAETILVDGPTLEQFLTIRERQGLRTWRWRIDTAQVPRVGDDGAVAFLDTKLHRLTDVSIAPAAILDAEGKDVTPNGPPLERRASERRLVADASPRRLEAPPPLRHRPGRDPPQHTDRHRDGHHHRHGDEADRRADERPPRRARDGDRQRNGEPRRSRMDARDLGNRGQRRNAGELLQDRGRVRARFLLFHLDDQPVRRRHRDRVLRREVHRARRPLQRRRKHEQHDERHGRHPHDDGERRHRPRLLRKREQLDVHPAGQLERARRRRHHRDQRLHRPTRSRSPPGPPATPSRHRRSPRVCTGTRPLSSSTTSLRPRR